MYCGESNHFLDVRLVLFSSSRFVLCDKDVNPVTLDYTTISGKVVSGSWSPCDILVIGVGIKTANLSNDTTSYALHNSWLFCKALWNRDALYLDQPYQSWALLVQMSVRHCLSLIPIFIPSTGTAVTLLMFHTSQPLASPTLTSSLPVPR